MMKPDERKNTVRPRGTDSAKVVQVIVTEALGDSGTANGLCRAQRRYWDFDGNLLATWEPEAVKERPYGWNSNSAAGHRGRWYAKDEVKMLEHMIDWLEDSKIAGQRDPAGNLYYGVDSDVIQQTIELLRRYRGRLAQQQFEK